MLDRLTADHDDHPEHDRFLIEEGLDLLAAFKGIRSREIRRAIVVMVASIAQGETDAENRAAARLES